MAWNCRHAFDGLKPIAGMVLVQCVLAGVSIFYKLAVNDGMDVTVLVACRHLFGAAFLSPVAFFIERKKRPRLTFKILAYAFLCGLFGFVGIWDALMAMSPVTCSCMFLGFMASAAL